MSQEHHSLQGTEEEQFRSDFGTSTQAVSQLFALGGFESSRRRIVLATFVLALLVIAGGAYLFTQPFATSSTALQIPLYQAAGQPEIYLHCEVLNEDGLSTRYGCNSHLRDGGAYHGIVWGWWQAVADGGCRVPMHDIEFRDGGYDMTFEVQAQQTFAGLAVIPRTQCSI